jgi:lycopene cyclase domain-containing protein
MFTITSSGWDGPGFLASGGVELSYWDLHGLLLLPTAWLLTVGRPLLLGDSKDPLTRTALFSYIGFILSIAVGQAFIWDSVGAEIGIWEFNPAKCTGLGAGTLLPLEEILWLFHHVVKAALWQLKMGEWSLTAAAQVAPVPLLPQVRSAGNAAILAAWVGGICALIGDADSAKCMGLVATFFAPVFLVVFNLGSRYWASHWRLFAAGWLPPGMWTVFIDCVGQQQAVWNFPSRYLSGVSTLPGGLLKLDIAAVYLVSTFAVTATGGIILAAAQEFELVCAARREAQAKARPALELGDGAVEVHGTDGSGGTDDGQQAETLWDFGLFIFHGAAPRLAERVAELLPPATSSWRVADEAGSPLTSAAGSPTQG